MQDVVSMQVHICVLVFVQLVQLFVVLLRYVLQYFMAVTVVVHHVHIVHVVHYMLTVVYLVQTFM